MQVIDSTNCVGNICFPGLPALGYVNLRQSVLIVLSVWVGLPTTAHLMFELVLSPLSPDLLSFSFHFFHSGCAG
jgi:hypothetical protein